MDSPDTKTIKQRENTVDIRNSADAKQQHNEAILELVGAIANFDIVDFIFTARLRPKNDGTPEGEANAMCLIKGPIPTLEVLLRRATEAVASTTERVSNG